jgi:DNA topoisomerase I
MSQKTLIIVESPGKISKICSILGSKYRVVASMGHVCDLNPNKLSVDMIEQTGTVPTTYNFIPHYIVKHDRNSTLAKLRKEVAGVGGGQNVILATDQDREGEFIAHTLRHVLGLPIETRRIVFDQITRDAVKTAVESPRVIDQNMVMAQKGRRVMDRLVGYLISPLLGKGLSAGRVQSAVLRLIVERSQEHLNRFSTKLKRDKHKVSAAFCVSPQFLNNVIIKDASLISTLQPFTRVQETADYIYNDEKWYEVKNVTVKQESINPPPPLTTSSLQQEAWNKLHWKGEKTMLVAQHLYEKGYITYMRTDSTNISMEARVMLKSHILTQFEESYIRENEWRTESKHAQEAHECIRPTSSDTNLKTLNPDELLLFNLIQNRALMSQMAPCLTDVMTILLLQIGGNGHEFEARFRHTTFLGWRAVSATPANNNSSSSLQELPVIAIGAKFYLAQCTAEEELAPLVVFYNESTLVKEMEKRGIGRPSTYACTLKLLRDRNYIEETDFCGVPTDVESYSCPSNQLKIKQVSAGAQSKCLTSTQTGESLINFMVQEFPVIVDYTFTAHMESCLDQVASGDVDWQVSVSELLTSFYPRVLALKSGFSLRTPISNTNKQQESSSNKQWTDTENGIRYSVVEGKYGLVLRKDCPATTTEANKYVTIFVSIKKPPVSLIEAKEVSSSHKYLGTHRGKALFVVPSTNTANEYYLKYGSGSKVRRICIHDNKDIAFEMAKKLL